MSTILAVRNFRELTKVPDSLGKALAQRGRSRVISADVVVLTQSLKIKPRIPAVISRRSRIARNIAY